VTATSSSAPIESAAARAKHRWRKISSLVKQWLINSKQMQTLKEPTGVLDQGIVVRPTKRPNNFDTLQHRRRAIRPLAQATTQCTRLAFCNDEL
jgi:hypothetical protein